MSDANLTRSRSSDFDWAWWLVHLAGPFTMIGSIVAIAIDVMWPIFAGLALTILGWAIALRNA